MLHLFRSAFGKDAVILDMAVVFQIFLSRFLHEIVPVPHLVAVPVGPVGEFFFLQNSVLPSGQFEHAIQSLGGGVQLLLVFIGKPDFRAFALGQAAHLQISVVNHPKDHGRCKVPQSAVFIFNQLQGLVSGCQVPVHGYVAVPFHLVLLYFGKWRSNKGVALFIALSSAPENKADNKCDKDYPASPGTLLLFLIVVAEIGPNHCLVKHLLEILVPDAGGLENAFVKPQEGDHGFFAVEGTVAFHHNQPVVKKTGSLIAETPGAHVGCVHLQVVRAYNHAHILRCR